MKLSVKCFLLLGAISSALAVVPVNNSQAATLLFEEYFEGVDTSSGPVNASTSNTAFSNVTRPTGSTIAIIEDPTDATNNVLNFIDNTTSTGVHFTATLGTMTTGGLVRLSFDFLDPVTTHTDPTRISLANNSNVGSESISASFKLQDGALIGVSANLPSGDLTSELPYTPNAPHNLVAYVNYSTEAVNYGDGLLGAHQYDVWIDGVLFADNWNFRAKTGLMNATHLRFAGDSNNAISSLVLDNLLVEEIVPVPEPNAMSLLGMACMGMGLLRRRMK